MDWPARRSRVRELVEEFYLPLYRYAYRLTGTQADAEDLTQEAFCKAQMQLHQLRDPERVRPWLFAILRNDYLRQRRDARPFATLGADVEANAIESNSKLDYDGVQAALASLPESFRTPLILYYFGEFTYRDIADQMQVPIGTVMSRLSRAKMFLRERLLAAKSEVQ